MAPQVVPCLPLLLQYIIANHNNQVVCFTAQDTTSGMRTLTLGWLRVRLGPRISQSAAEVLSGINRAATAGSAESSLVGGVATRRSEVRAWRTLVAHERSIISFQLIKVEKGLGCQRERVALSGYGSPRATSHFQLATNSKTKPNTGQDKPNSRRYSTSDSI